MADDLHSAMQARTEREVRARVAAEVLRKFGATAPYRMVAEFIEKGPGHPIRDDPTEWKGKRT